MKKRTGAALVLLLVLGMSAIRADAESATVPLHVGGANCHGEPAGPATANSFVMMNTAGKPFAANDVIVNVQLKNGTPNTVYDIWVNGPAGCPVAPNGGTLTTNAKGHGHANVKLSGIDAPGGPHDFQVQLNPQGAPFPVAFTSELAFLD